MDVGAVSAGVLRAFEVPFMVARGVEEPRAEVGVFHLGAMEWHSHSTSQQVALDTLSVLESVDIEPGDVITCSDTRAVPAESTWTVADRIPSDGDRYIYTWRIVEEL